MKTCAYCGQLIKGKAKLVPDYAERGAHAEAYWHANPGECGPRVPRTTPLDDGPSPLQRHLLRAGRRRSS